MHCKADILSEEICDEELSECNQFDSYDNEGDVVSILSDQGTTGTNNNIYMHTYKDGQLVIIIVDDDSEDNTVTPRHSVM